MSSSLPSVAIHLWMPQAQVVSQQARSPPSACSSLEYFHFQLLISIVFSFQTPTTM